MLEIILKFLGPVFVVSVFFSILRFSQRKETSDSSGDMVLEHGRLLKAIPLFGFCCAIGFPVIMYIKEVQLHGSPGPIIYYVLASGFFLLSAIYLYFDFFLTKLIVNGATIFYKSPWGKSKYVAIHDIERVDFSQVFKYYKLRIRNDGVINVYMYMKGVPHFLDFLEKELKIRIERYY